MASISTLEGLFELAAADWNAPPPPPVEGGGHAPKVTSRTIKVQFTFTPAGAVTLASKELPGTLTYVPAATATVKGLPSLVPAHFSGPASNQSNTSYQVTITAPDLSGRTEYSVVAEVVPSSAQPVKMSFDLPLPGGGPPPPSEAHPPVAGPALDVFFASPTFPAVGEGGTMSCTILLWGYDFKLTIA
jgi:hypothetical protein